MRDTEGVDIRYLSIRVLSWETGIKVTERSEVCTVRRGNGVYCTALYCTALKAHLETYL